MSKRFVPAEPGHYCDKEQNGKRYYTCGAPAIWYDTSDAAQEDYAEAFFCDEHRPKEGEEE